MIVRPNHLASHYNVSVETKNLFYKEQNGFQAFNIIEISLQKHTYIYYIVWSFWGKIFADMVE